MDWIGSSELLVSPRFLSQSDLMNSMLYGGGSQRLSAGFPFEGSGSHTIEVADPKSEVGKLRSGATSYLTPGITQGTVAV